MVYMGPTVRLEVDQMRYSVLHAFTQHNQEIAQMLEAELDKAIQEFDFAMEARKAVMAVLPRLVDDALKSALQRVLETAELRSELDAIAHNAISRYVSKMAED